MDSNDDLADLACLDCRRLKRRCTKELPKCALCARVGRTCDYGAALPTPPSAHGSAGVARECNGDGLFGDHLARFRPQKRARLTGPDLLKARERLLPAFFLDSVASRNSEPPAAQPLLWTELVESPGTLDADAAWVTAQKHFLSSQDWLPVVSKVRIRRCLQDEASLARADTQALLHCMELLSYELKATSTSAYEAIKVALSGCERSGQFTTNFLAAQVLVAMFEIGHGIYPAAYLTVANVSRICYALGLHDKRKATQQLWRRSDTWTEVEERRRLWWAVLILDRYVHVGFRFRPLATSRIPPDEIIPANDNSWDAGELAVNPLLVMSMEANTAVSPFARTCQAAHLLGRVCEHVNEHPTSSDAEFHFQEAHQIVRTARALISILEQEAQEADDDFKFHFFVPKAICFSALSTLFDVHSCIEVEEIETVGGNRGLRLDLQQLAIDGSKDIAARVSSLADELKHHKGISLLGLISPLVLHCLYSAGGTYAWYYRETGKPEPLASLNAIRDVLSLASERWEAAGAYLSLLHDVELSYDGACFQ